MLRNPPLPARTRITAALILLAAATLLWSPPLALAEEPSGRLQLARRHMTNLRLDRALREIRKVLQSDPENLEAWKLRGQIALRQADLEGALTAWVEASRIAPHDVEMLTSIGDLLLRRNDRLDEALAVYGRALKIEPDNPRTLVSVGSIHERRGNWEQAAQAYKTALEIDPNFVRARSSLGAVLFKTGRYDDASRELRKAIELSPRDLRSHVFLGLSQNHLQNYEMALDELKEAIVIDPHSANQLIGVREQQPQFSRLVELFMKAYDASPREAGRSYDLAVVHYYGHDYEAAWRFLTRAEQLRYPIPIEMKEVIWSRRRLRSP